MFSVSFFGILTFLTIAVGVWSALVAIGVAKVMRDAYKQRGFIRSDDTKVFSIAAFTSMFSYFVVFIHPGLIYMIPSTLAFFELLSIPVLWMTSRQYLHSMTNLKASKKTC